MKKHNAEEYTVSVRLETIEGEKYFVGRVAELPDVEEYADTAQQAFDLALDTVRTTQKVFAEEGREFPAPHIFENDTKAASGRVTLRLRRTTHRKAIENAKREGVSLNAYLCAKIENDIDSSDILNVFNMLRNLELQISKLDEQSRASYNHSVGYHKFAVGSQVGLQQKVELHRRVRIDESDIVYTEGLGNAAFYPGFLSNSGY
ncbi:toxin-antitoxin system HicB family antitoxin [Citrobacter freundii]|uniref:toxin-antitoxin system HicB family antitoxin n=1 Tax=Citrobacter freundii TaxID=546 RepID=UPI0022457F98|nr:toxin-antitoxin system HicB family antitoxin [Citrobacter freundii]MCX2442342.1 type II toxin-antitoxin system HicB family antitoxin [Citrobacter freundii]MCX2470810.1 type II toxin-antitoxin system HicB family antitoxin [Citrobacter freundii]UZQ87639.1 type II toxin-antitoxin system HicB family antitoxin [Citrobacter freundii]UZQ93977.1 type II toxin-antitoxin system HicB family antitoxin [Citrobacter freundii]UZQ98482.1 type II toxin-antitoxin system HicB family antitoxin [Citrobacter fre